MEKRGGGQKGKGGWEKTQNIFSWGNNYSSRIKEKNEVM